MSASTVRRSGFHRDPLFWLALAAGAVVAAGIGHWVPVEAFPAISPIAWPVIAMVLVYPVLEELAFRGLLQGWLLSYPWGRGSRLGVTAANLLTTAAFSALHFLHHPPAWAALVAVPSLVFGFFRDRSGTVLPAIILHAAYNLFYVLAVAS